MKKTNKKIAILNNSFQIEAPIYIDKDNCEYAKINKHFIAIDTITYAGYLIKEIRPE